MRAGICVTVSAYAYRHAGTCATGRAGRGARRRYPAALLALAPSRPCAGVGVSPHPPGGAVSGGAAAVAGCEDGLAGAMARRALVLAAAACERVDASLPSLCLLSAECLGGRADAPPSPAAGGAPHPLLASLTPRLVAAALGRPAVIGELFGVAGALVRRCAFVVDSSRPEHRPLGLESLELRSPGAAPGAVAALVLVASGGARPPGEGAWCARARCTYSLPACARARCAFAFPVCARARDVCARVPALWRSRVTACVCLCICQIMTGVRAGSRCTPRAR